MSINGESQLLERISSALADRPLVAFDVGAHRGVWTDRLLDVCPKVEVYCFEVLPRMNEVLMEKYKQDSRVTVVNCGLGNDTGTTEVYAVAEAPVLSTTSKTLVEAYETYQYTIEECRLHRADDVIRELGLRYVHLLKVDVEGTEFDVLKGCEETIRQARIGLIQFEFKGLNHLVGSSLYSITSYLSRLGYVTGQILPNGVRFDSYNPRLEGCSVSNHLSVATNRIDLLRALSC
jgi:FkbM family methyltransferase